MPTGVSYPLNVSIFSNVTVIGGVLEEESAAVEDHAPRVEQQVLQVDRVHVAVLLEQQLRVDAAEAREQAREQRDARAEDGAARAARVVGVVRIARVVADGELRHGRAAREDEDRDLLHVREHALKDDPEEDARRDGLQCGEDLVGRRVDVGEEVNGPK